MDGPSHTKNSSRSERQKMPHTYTNLLFHIVFSTKDRHPFISAEIEERLCEYIGGTIRSLDGICIEIGGIEDHIHMLVKLRSTMDVSTFLRKLKPSVTKWARSVIHPKFEWQDGYGAFTISETQIKGVARYIHKKQAFDDEFKEMLRKANIDFEERFLWR
jgi:putative transposase